MGTEHSQSRLGDQIPEFLVSDHRVIFLESIIVLSIVWSLLAHGLNMVDRISSPSLVLIALFELLMSGVWIPHIIATTRRILYGFALTLVVGTILGVLMGMSKFWEHALRDYITIGMALPSLFAAIFAAMWFGLEDVTPMVAGALIAFPFLTQNVYEGVRNIDPGFLEMSTSFNVSRNRVIRRVILQSILPEWFAGARYSFALCWKITALTELIVADEGLGYMIEFQLNQLSVTGVLSWTLLFTLLIIFVEYGIFQRTEKTVFSWREKSSIQMIG